MKSLLRIFSIALIVCVAVVSCGKITPTGGNEQGGDTPGSQPGGGEEQGGNTDPDATPRVIIISFDTKSTRTELDGGKPHFVNGDVILVAQKNGGAVPQRCTVCVDGGIASITVPTSLTGTLTAVYPADAAKMDASNSNKIDGIIVPSEQTGLFKDANICMVDIKETDTRVIFKNQIALIAVKVPENTDYIEVTSLYEISEEISGSYFTGKRGDKRIAINSDSSEQKQHTTIVSSGQSYGLNSGDGVYGGDTYYVAVLTDYLRDDEFNTNVKLIDLNFDILCKDSGNNDIHMMGGFPPMQVFKNIENLGYTLSVYPGVSDTRYIHAVASSIYNLPISFLHEYVVVKGFKMATMNVGAGEPEEPGDYFFWAGLDGHKFINGQWNKFSNDAIFDYYANLEDCFSPYNTPYTIVDDVDDDGYTCYRYNANAETVLSLWDDAAYVNWGGAWRMPTLDDMTHLIKNGSQSISYVDGHFEFSVDGKSFIFPKSGYGEGTGCNKNDETRLWLSTVDSEKKAYDITIAADGTDSYYISVGDFNDSFLRCAGLNIRPVSGTPSEEPDEPDDDGLILEIDPYTNGWGTSN